jgi:hypothetical protein
MVAVEITLAAIAGGLVALVLVGLIDPTGEMRHVDIAVLAVGIFGGVGLDRLLRG